MTSSTRSKRFSTKLTLPILFLSSTAFALFAGHCLQAQTEDSKEKILADQARLAEQYELLEKKLFSLYQYEQQQNPERAALLKNAFQQSREKLTLQQFKKAVELLQQARLREAQTNQQLASDQLRELLELLQSEDRSKRIREQLRQLQEYRKQVNQILRTQQGVRSQTENQNDPRSLEDAQKRIIERTKELKAKMEDARKGSSESPNAESPSEQQNGEPKKPEGQPSDPSQQNEPQNETPSQSESSEGQPSDPVEAAEQQLQKALQNMQQAQQNLQKAQASQSVEAMRQAEQELEKAKRELEKILRQLREEEIQRTLDSLEASFRTMLQAEIKLNNKTVSFDSKRQQLPVDEQETQSIQLAKKQTQLANDAGQVLLILEDEGSAVATMESVRQVQNDMQQIAQRLSAGKSSKLTQELQSGVIDSLRFLVEIFAEARKEQQERNQKQQPPSDEGGQPGQRPLINQLAELKLLRGMQQQILTRHERYSTLVSDPQIEAGHTDDPGLQDALEKLSRRQMKLQQITDDIVSGNN